MGWKNLDRDLAEMFGGLEGERVSAAGLVKAAGSLRAQREQRDRDAAIPETRAQKTARKRRERAARVAGLARGNWGGK